MRIKEFAAKGWVCLDVLDPITADTSMVPLEDAIKAAAQKGSSYVAVRLAKDSYLCSRSIAALMTCNNLLKGKDGVLAILEPSEDMVDLFDTLGISNLVIMSESQEALPLASEL